MKKDFLSILDFSREDIEELFSITDVLKKNHDYKPLMGKSASLIFQKPSLPLSLPAASDARAAQQALSCIAFLMLGLQSGLNGKCLAVTEILPGYLAIMVRNCISMPRQSLHWKSEKIVMRTGAISGP